MNELRPLRDLLDPGFDGYKLSLASVPVYKLQLSKGVDVVEPSEDQYSYLHQREFSLHNHLHSDPWQPLNVYFIDTEWNVSKAIVNQITGRPESISNVFPVPKSKDRCGGEFNLSLLFPSRQLVVIGDGFKALHIISTSPREEPSSQWQLVHSEDIFEECHPFHVTDAVCSSEGGRLHCLILHVEPKHDDELQAARKENKNTSKYETVLQWITFKLGEDSKWTLERNEEMRGSGKVEYSALETGGSAVYIASQHKFKIPKLEQQSCDKTTSNGNGDKVDFEWQQSFDDITIYIDGVDSAEGISVTVDQKNVVIKHRDKTLLSGTLSRNVSCELTTWTIDQQRLEVVLQKCESGTMWQKLLMESKSKDDVCFTGKEIIDPNLAENISDRLSHLTSDTLESGSGVINDWQMEECDAFEEESITLFRFIPSSPDPTHKILVGGSQWLLTLRSDGGHPPCLCIRSDVDGCIWKLSPPAPQANASWTASHIGTFLAFGYILASKVNRKFTSAPQDLSYVSVVDNTGHVIIYRKGVAVGGELRNRKTNRQVASIATQSMVNLQTKENILGCVATASYLYILTETYLHLIHIQ